MAISSSMVTLATTIGIFALLALGLNIKFGYTGLLEIGHVAFYLLGGYVTALLILPPAAQNPGQEYILGLGLPWIVAIPIAMAVAGIVGALVSLPAIRLREDFLAITLLGMAFIVQQIFRSERWLANGPRALAGYDRPLNEAFPIPTSSGEIVDFGIPYIVQISIPAETVSAIVLGAITSFFFAVAILLLRRYDGIDDGPDDRNSLLHGLFAVTTLGVGYLAARRARQSHNRDGTIAAAGGLVVALPVAIATAALGSSVGQIVVFVVFGALSLFSWVFGATAFRSYYGELSRRELAIAAGLALTFLVTFLPLVVLGPSRNAALSFVGMLGWLALLAVYIYGLYYLSNEWDRYGDGTGFIRITGVAAIGVFLIRYFVLSVVPTLSTGAIVRGVADVVFNVLWLVKFDLNTDTIVFDYDRFLFTLVVASVVLVYVLSEITIKSPFGRVLKAIREDEDVATALGKNTFLYKVQSMAVGSAIAGLAGALTAIQFQSLTWSVFRIEVTFFALLMVIIGGTANNSGAILGSVIFWGFSRGTDDIAGFFPEAAGSSVQALRLVIIGALLIVILYYRPEGLWGEEHGTTETQGGPRTGSGDVGSQGAEVTAE